MGRCLDFYRGGRDHKGRTFESYLNMLDWQWEHSHDVVQYAFPLPEPSLHFRDAPLLQEDEIAEFRHDVELRINALVMFTRFLKFLGLKVYLSDAGVMTGIVVDEDKFHHARLVWIQPRSHNYKRISRILRFLTLIGLQEAADEFLACLKRIKAVDPRGGVLIDGKAMEFWENAVTGNPPLRA